jgi:hypothetical protein
MNKQAFLAALAGLSLACATTKGGESSSDAVVAKAAPAASELGTNLALNKPAVSSSDEKPELAAKAAVDGSLTTRWSSNFFTDAKPADAWIYVDLGEKTAIQTVLLNWEAAYGTEFTIMASDDAKEWKVIAEEKDGHAGKVVVKLKEPVETRFVKMQGIKRGTPYGYSLWEFEVYGK